MMYKIEAGGRDFCVATSAKRDFPQAANAVSIEYCFGRNQNKMVRKSLGNEHSVEWIAMRAWQRAGPNGVVYSDW